MACQHFPDDQTLRLQAGAGEDDVIHLPSGLDRVDCERQEEEEDFTPSRLVCQTFRTGGLITSGLGEHKSFFLRCGSFRNQLASITGKFVKPAFLGYACLVNGKTTVIYLNFGQKNKVQIAIIERFIPIYALLIW